MSEQPTAPPSRGGGGNVFTRKLGPLPMWVWMLIILVAAGGYYLLRKNAGGSASANSQAAQAAGNTPGGVDASLVPQFVNQTYTNVQPPAAPNVTVNNNPPPTGGNTTPPPSTSPLNEVLTSGHAISVNPAKAVIGWTIKTKSPNATQLQVVLNGPGAKNQTRYVPASATTATFDNLQPGHTYVADVTPMDAQGQAIGGPNHVTFVTAKK